MTRIHPSPAPSVKLVYPRRRGGGNDDMRRAISASQSGGSRSWHIAHFANRLLGTMLRFPARPSHSTRRPHYPARFPD